MTERLPGGDKAWFVRVRQGRKLKINPCSVEGWIATGVYAVGSALTFLLLAPKPSGQKLILWAAVFGAWALIFVVFCFRMSAPLAPDSSGERR